MRYSPWYVYAGAYIWDYLTAAIIYFGLGIVWCGVALSDFSIEEANEWWDEVTK